ncbi:hypothetical protein TRVA0_007S02300 [Trichomonascus vanleenenianus]|uniref:O-methyltransferase n=1 Tax=Trichomonascus vanleenenianus TaxID=2268995 RepID=UPI003EC98331
MGKEQDLLQHVKSLPNLEEIRGNPDKVLEVLDAYGREHRFMNVGTEKGAIVVDELRAKKPKVAIELGCYVGFSAILFSKELPPGGKYYGFEFSPEYAEIARYHIDLAGLSDRVKIFVGPASETLVEFAKDFETIDFAFVDHAKDKYIPDVMTLENLGLIKPGTVVTADNVGFERNKPYVAYMQGSPEERKEIVETTTNLNGNFKGNWKLKYKSETRKPTPDFWDAVEVSHCIGYAN